MTSRYLLLYATEDGSYARFMGERELAEMLENPREYAGISNFYRVIPSMRQLDEYDDGFAVLLRVELVVPEPKTLAWRING